MNKYTTIMVSLGWVALIAFVVIGLCVFIFLREVFAPNTYPMPLPGSLFASYAGFGLPQSATIHYEENRFFDYNTGRGYSDGHYSLVFDALPQDINFLTQYSPWAGYAWGNPPVPNASTLNGRFGGGITWQNTPGNNPYFPPIHSPDIQFLFQPLDNANGSDSGRIIIVDKKMGRIWFCCWKL